MPSRRATASAVVRLSPVSMTTRTFSLRQRRAAPRRGGLDRIGDGEHRRQPCRRRRAKIAGRAVAGAGARPRASSAAVSMPTLAAGSAALPSASLRPSTVPSTPLPVGESKPETSDRASLRSAAAATIGARPADARSPAPRWRRAAARRSRRSPARARSPSPRACPRSACRSCRRPGCRSAPCAPAPRRS